MTRYKPLRNGRLYEQIVEQIEQQVLSGVLSTGDRLPPERQLAEQFGVSRTAVREAVKALRQRGLIEVFPGRGTFITDGTSQALQDSFGLAMRVGQKDGFIHLIELREIMEPTIAAKAAERATKAQIETMAHWVDRMDQVLTNPEAFISADFAFHNALAEASQNPLLPTLMNSIVDLIQDQRLQVFKIDGGQRRSQDQHKQILQAIRSKDADAAYKAMKNHLQKVRADHEK
ncbi:MAG: FadR/GntR family transcriptional regulator [Candidatus Promineifilaceae bacterium]